MNENISNAIRKHLYNSQTIKNRIHWEQIIKQKLSNVLIHLENQFNENIDY